MRLAWLARSGVLGTSRRSRSNAQIRWTLLLLYGTKLCTAVTMESWTDFSTNFARLRSLVASKRRDEAPHATGHSLLGRLANGFSRTWDLGFTAFGGPPVHFKIFHQRFVEGQGGKEKWVDEQTVNGSPQYIFEIETHGKLP